jgi:hypothetical protein
VGAGLSAGAGAGLSEGGALALGLFAAGGGESGEKVGLLLGGVEPTAFGASISLLFDSNENGAGFGLGASAFFGSDALSGFGTGGSAPPSAGASGGGLGGDSDGGVPPTGAEGGGGAVGGVGAGFESGLGDDDSNGMPVFPMLGESADAAGGGDVLAVKGGLAGVAEPERPVPDGEGFVVELSPSDNDGGSVLPPCPPVPMGDGVTPEPSDPPVRRIVEGEAGFAVPLLVDRAPGRMSDIIGPIEGDGARFALGDFCESGPLLSFLSGAVDFSAAADVCTSLSPPGEGEDFPVSLSPGSLLAGETAEGTNGLYSGEAGGVDGEGDGDDAGDEGGVNEGRLPLASLPGFDGFGAFSFGAICLRALAGLRRLA